MAKVEASLPQFERSVVERNHEHALTTAVAILDAINISYGRLDRVAIGNNDKSLAPDDAVLVFCTRFAAAFARMIVDKDFNLSPLGYEALLAQHRWIDIIFSLSGFRSSDHLFPLLAETDGSGSWSYGGGRLLRVLVIRALSSRAALDFDQVWRANKAAAGLALLHYLDATCVITARGLVFRDRVLEWLPDRIDEVSLGPLTLSNLQNAYMHCSYASTPTKHAIKAGLVRQMRRACLDAGCKEFMPAAGPRPAERPTIVVVLERFGKDHSVYRTHWLALRSLREQFHVVWVGYPRQIDDEFKNDFDEMLPIPTGEFLGGVRKLADEILSRNPAIVFHVGVGMSAAVIALASLRLAPVQCASFGHTATTMSPAIDYMILPEDFIGAPECFSEKLIALPKQAIPFMPPPVKRVRNAAKRHLGSVRIAVVASAMKLNARLIESLNRIAATAKTPVEFQFFPAFAIGLVHRELARTIGRELRNSVVHAESPRAVYFERLTGCDLFLCPFPYGNMNGLIDALTVGLPGVCLDGPEAHAHADAALFARAGLPPELVAQTTDEYVAAAVHLIEDVNWRSACRQMVVSCDLDQAFFRGDAKLFCRAMADLIRPTAEPGGSPLPAHSRSGAAC